MLTLQRLCCSVALLAAAVVAAGCAGAGSMTDQQRAAFELRRYCETHTEDLAKCLGYLGDH